MHLFRPDDAVRRSIPAVIDFRVSRTGRRVRIDVLTDDGEHVRTLVDEAVDAGTHRARWNLRYPGAVTFERIVPEGR